MTKQTVDEMVEAAKPHRPKAGRSAEWLLFHQRARRLPPVSSAELRRRLQAATPATDDDVPRRFTVRTPVVSGPER